MTIVVLILIIGNLIHKRLRRMRLITENENMGIIELDILNSNFLDKSKVGDGGDHNLDAPVEVVHTKERKPGICVINNKQVRNGL